MSIRGDIIKTIENDFKGKLNKSNGYSMDLIECKVGVANHTEFPQLPALSFFPTTDPITDETLDGNRERSIQILLWGWTNNPEDIFNLSEDVEKFLYSKDFTYTDQTYMDEEGPSFAIGGTTESSGIAMFFMRFRIHYTQSF